MNEPFGDSKQLAPCAGSGGDARTQFEAWAARECYPTDRAKGNPYSYEFLEVRLMWQGWQAALAARQPADDPEFDGTDGAHPAYLRGTDAGVAGAVSRIEAALDGKDDGAGVLGSDRLEALRRRILAELQQPRCGPSYESLHIIVGSIAGALERAGITECDDPGEAIDVMRERYERRIAELQAEQPASSTGAGNAEIDEELMCAGLAAYVEAKSKGGRHSAVVRAVIRATLAARQPVGEPVAVVGGGFTLFWAGSGPIAPLVKRHGIKVGSKLYAAPPAPAAAQSLDELMQQAASNYPLVALVNALDKVAPGFKGSMAKPVEVHAPAAVPVDVLHGAAELLRVIEANGEWEDGCFYYHYRSASELQAPLIALRKALATHLQPAAAEPSNQPDSKREQELQHLERTLGLKREAGKPAAAGGDA